MTDRPITMSGLCITISDTPKTREELLALGTAAMVDADDKQTGYQRCRHMLEVALTAIEAAGCDVVPREATEGMLKAWYASEQFPNAEPFNGPDIDGGWPAMLAASPFVKETKGDIRVE